MMGFAKKNAYEGAFFWLYPSYELRPLICNRPERSCRKLPAFFGAHRLLIDIEPKTGALRQRNISVDGLERIGTKAAAEVLEGQEIFRDDEVRHACGGMHG